MKTNCLAAVVVCLLYALLCTIPAHAQSEKQLNPNKLLNDFDKLLTIIDAHPDPYTHVSEGDFMAHAAAVRASLDQPHSTLEFYRKVSSLVALIKDGHSSVRLPSNWLSSQRKEQGAFPYKFHLTSDDELFILKGFEDNPIPGGTKVLQINGITVDSFLARIDPYISYEKKAFRNTLIDSDFERYLYLAFGQSNNTELQYFSTDTLTATISNMPYRDWRSFQKDEKEERESKIARGEPYSYEKVADGIGLIHIYAFRTSDVDDYLLFLRKTFRNIQEDGIHSLIIDIRGNFGGWPKISSYLFHYISEGYFKTLAQSSMKVSNVYREYIYSRSPALRQYERYVKLPKRNHYVDLGAILRAPLDSYVNEEIFFNEQPETMDFEFTGDTYLLTNRDSYSAASSFASTFQCYQMGFIIGEETGGTKIFRANPIYFLLDKSDISVGMSTTLLKTTCFSEEMEGVLPNIEYTPSIFELTSDLDTQLMYTLRVIRKVQKQKALEEGNE